MNQLNSSLLSYKPFSIPTIYYIVESVNLYFRKVESSVFTSASDKATTTSAVEVWPRFKILFVDATIAYDGNKS